MGEADDGEAEGGASTCGGLPQTRHWDGGGRGTCEMERESWSLRRAGRLLKRSSRHRHADPGVEMAELANFKDVFDGIVPFEGEVPRGYLVDFLGSLTDARFREYAGLDPETVGGASVSTRLPELEADGEGWFEAVDWVVAAREARNSYVMITLGACYGAQAVGACRALRLLNPMPYRLVAVEPVPENFSWIAQHMRDNAIEPDDQWLLPFAISDGNAPVFFPIGAPGSGAQNCYSTNERAAREAYVKQLVASGPEEALRNLVLHNTTGISKDLVPGEGLFAEIQLMSAITLRDVLAPFEFVDYLESDIQQSEILVFPACRDLLRKRVRRIHIGTHGGDVHRALEEMFADDGWEVVFSYEPNSSFVTPLGSFAVNDGVLTVRNPDL